MYIKIAKKNRLTELYISEQSEGGNRTVQIDVTTEVGGGKLLKTSTVSIPERELEGMIIGFSLKEGVLIDEAKLDKYLPINL